MPIVIDKEILNNRGVLIHVKPRSHHHQNGGHHHSSNKHHGSSKHHQNGGGGSHHKHHHNKNKHHHRSRKDRIKAESSALVTPGMFNNQTKKEHAPLLMSEVAAELCSYFTVFANSHFLGFFY